MAPTEPDPTRDATRDVTTAAEVRAAQQTVQQLRDVSLKLDRLLVLFEGAAGAIRAEGERTRRAVHDEAEMTRAQFREAVVVFRTPRAGGL